MCQLSSPLCCNSQCSSKTDKASSNDNNYHKISIPKENDNLIISNIKTPLIKSQEDVGTTTTTTSTNKAILREAKSISRIAFPMILTGLILYSRSMISMLFLGRLGHLSLAGGSLAMAFANITGYSVLSGLATGMEPICGQAFGANRRHLLGLSLQRTVLLLLLASVPISLLWLNIRPLLLLSGQSPSIAAEAQSFLLFSLPDLLAQSLLHPIRIYLRSQSITLPLTYCSAAAILLHIPTNFLLVSVLGLGIRGVALSSAVTNLNLVLALVLYIVLSGVHATTWPGVSAACLRDWRQLVNLAIPSCVSVCLEWWWYEIMILLCGFLANPTAAVASMGILIQTTSLIYIFPSSLSFSVSTRVGNELGANRPGRARLAAAVGLGGSLAFGLAALGFAAAVRGVWARMFTDDEEIVALTSLVLPIIGLCEIGNCPQTTGCGVLRGTARPRVGANINLGCFYVVGMPVALGLAFVFGFGFEGLWLGLLAAQICCAVTMLVVLGLTDWEAEAKRAMVLTGTNNNINNNYRNNNDDQQKAQIRGDGLLYVEVNSDHSDSDNNGDDDYSPV